MPFSIVVLSKVNSVLRKNCSNSNQLFAGQSLGAHLKVNRRCLENLSDIHYCVPGDCEGHTGLPGWSILNAHNYQGARVKYGRQCSQPRLIIVLRTKVAEHGVREMAFEQLRRPTLPLFQQQSQAGKTISGSMPAQQFNRARG